MDSLQLRRVALLGLVAFCGCRGYQYGHLLKSDAPDMVGSHSAGSEVYKPLVEEAVARLLGSCNVSPEMMAVAPDGTVLPRRVVFVGIENKSSEELGDFKDHLYELIDARINRSTEFASVSKRMVDAALESTRLRPEELLLRDGMQTLTAILQSNGQPADYLLFATMTSGTTERNKSSQRDYLLTLDLVDVRTGVFTKEQAEISKGYHKSPLGKLANYSLFPAGR
ncbi:MAG: hypothetical protein Aurels2KO_08530 [Aureliella sp.]